MQEEINYFVRAKNDNFRDAGNNEDDDSPIEGDDENMFTCV